MNGAERRQAELEARAALHRATQAHELAEVLLIALEDPRVVARIRAITSIVDLGA